MLFPRTELALILVAGGLLVAAPASSPTIEAARAARSAGDLQNALRLLETALADSRDSAVRAQVLEELADVELALGRYPDATGHSLDCAAQARSTPRTVVSCLGIAGRARLLSGDYTAARSNFARALDVARRASLPDAQATLLNNLGSCAFYEGSYSEAYDLYQRARRLVDANNSAPWRDHARTLTYANLATLYLRLGQYERALTLYRELERDGGELKPAQRAQMISNVGALYRRMGDPYKAIRQYEAAARMFGTDRNADGEIGVIKNTGIALAMDLRDFSGANAAFRRALKLARDTGNQREAVQAGLYLGETLRLSKETAEARSNLEWALEQATRLNLKEERWKALVSLGRVAEDIGDRAAALGYYRQAIAIIESLRTDISLAHLRTTFLADKRDAYDAAIAALLRSNAADPNELFRYMEQSRGRALNDRARSSSGIPALGDIQKQVRADTALVEYWRSGDAVGAMLIRRDSTHISLHESLPRVEISDLIGRGKRGGSPREPLWPEPPPCCWRTWRSFPRRCGGSLSRATEISSPFLSRLSLFRTIRHWR